MGIRVGLLPSLPKDISQPSCSAFGQELARTMGIQKQVVFASEGLAGGNNFFPFGKVVAICSDDDKIEITKFHICHDIVHIKYNDRLILPLLVSISSIATMILFTSTLPIGAYAIGIASAVTTYCWLSRHFEIRADRIAFEKFPKSAEKWRAIFADMDKQPLCLHQKIIRKFSEAFNGRGVLRTLVAQAAPHQ